MDQRLSKKMVPLGGNLYEEIRFFSNEKIQSAIDGALENVSQNKKGVVLRVDADGEGVKTVIAAKPNENWTIGVIAEYDWGTKDYAAGAQVVFEW